MKTRTEKYKEIHVKIYANNKVVRHFLEGCETVGFKSNFLCHNKDQVSQLFRLSSPFI